MKAVVNRVQSRLRAFGAGLLGAAALIALMAPAAGAVTASYGFDTGDQGWLASQSVTDPFAPPDFNPAGYIHATDTGPDDGCPGSPCDLLFFSGLLPGTMAANYGGTLSFDFATSTAPQYLGTAYIDSASDTAPELRRDFAPAPSGFAKTTLPLTEAGWRVCSGSSCAPATQEQFRSLLASGVTIHVLADVHAGTGQTYSLDNVSVAEAPIPAAAKKKKCKKTKGKKKGKKGAAAKKKKKCKKKKKGKKRSARVAHAVPSPAGRSTAVAVNAKKKRKKKRKGFRLERTWAHTNTDGLAVDPGGSVYATDGETIRRFSPKGKLLGSWGSAGAAPGQLNDAHGLAIDLQGNVLVADYANNRIQVFTPSGGFIREFGAPFGWSPWDLDVGPDGTIYVVDLANDAVHRFAPDGTYGGGIGGTGTGDGKFNLPSGIAADRKGRYFIADAGNDRVQAFDAVSGLFLARWGQEGAGPGQFTAPSDVAVSPKGVVFVSDNTPASGRVQQFSARGAIRGKPLRRFGKRDGFDAGALLDFDARGNLYAAENTAGNQRILKFRPGPKKGKKKRRKKEGRS